MDEDSPAPQQGFQATMYDGIESFVQQLSWSEEELEELDPEGHLLRGAAARGGGPLNCQAPPSPVQTQRVEQGPAQQQQRSTTDQLSAAHDNHAAHSFEPLFAELLASPSPYATASVPGSASASTPMSRRRSSAAETDGAMIQRSLENFRPFSPSSTPASYCYAGAGAAPGACAPQPHPQPYAHAQPVAPNPGGAYGATQPAHGAYGGCAPSHAHAGSPTGAPRYGGGGLCQPAHALLRPSHSPAAPPSRGPIDCSNPMSEATAAGTFVWEPCAVEGTRLRRLFEEPSAARAPSAAGAAGDAPTVSIDHISMVRPFMQSQSMLHYWYRTWKLPRVTISVANALSTGAACTVSLHAITVSAPFDSVGRVELRGVTSAPLVGGQATFSGLMFGTTSYAHANSLFHLMAQVECKGQMLSARISTGMHVFSKNKQRISAAPDGGAAGSQPARARTGSQRLETARCGEGGAWPSCPASSPRSGCESGWTGDDNDGATMACGYAADDAAGCADPPSPAPPCAFAGGSALDLHSHLNLNPRVSPKRGRRPADQSPLLGYGAGCAAGGCGIACAYTGCAPAAEHSCACGTPQDIKRQRSREWGSSGSPFSSRGGSPALLRGERMPFITVHHACGAGGADDGRAREGGELGGGLGARRGSAPEGGHGSAPTSLPPRPSRLSRTQLASHELASAVAAVRASGGNASLLRSRRTSDSSGEFAESAAMPPPAQPLLPPPLRLRVLRTEGPGGGYALAPVAGAGGAEHAAGEGAASSSSAPPAPLPAWLCGGQCHCLRGSRVFVLALHAAEGADGGAPGALPAEGYRAAPELPLFYGDCGGASGAHAPAHAQRAPAPAAPPALAISVRHASTNLDEELGGGGSLAGAVGLPVTALFDLADAALLADCVGRLWPAAATPALAAPTGGGSVDLGELALREASLPGRYAGLRIHAVLLCTPAPPIAGATELARPHLTVACRALAPGERADGVGDGAAAGGTGAAVSGCDSGALAVLSECGDVIARLDSGLRIAYVSPNCDELSGYSPHELLGLELTAPGWLLHADDGRQLRETALDPAHRAAAERAAASAGGQQAKGRQPVRLRALVRMASRGAAALSWVEMVLAHTYAPAAVDEQSGTPLPRALEAITVVMREKEWRHYDGGGGPTRA